MQNFKTVVLKVCLKHVIYLLASVFFLTSVPTNLAFAARDTILLQNPISVYSAPNEKSPILRIFERGERLQILPGNEKGWSKARVRVEGQWRTGWVSAEDLNLAAPAEKSQDVLEAKSESFVFHQTFSIGVMGAFSQVMQSASPTDTSTGVSLTKGSLSGGNGFFGISGIIPLTEGLALSSDLRFRQMSLSGSFTYGGSTSNTYQINENYVGVSSILRSYFKNDGNAWWGGGFELSYGSQPTVTFNGGQTFAGSSSSTSSSYNGFLLAELAAGLDYQLAGAVYLMPEVRFGYVALFSPAALAAEVHVGLSYAF